MSQEDIMSPAYEESRTTQGMKWLGRVIAVVIILAVAAFGDVMYIVLMTSHFPDGPLLVICYVGALTSFLSTIYLLIGKTSLFTPGKQSVFAWLVLFVELVIIGLNIVLVFHGQGSNQFLQAWDWLAPATPVLNMCLVAVLFFLDEEQIEKHKDMELQIKQNQMERKYKTAVFKAKIDLQHKQLQYLSSELQKAVNTPESLSFLQQTALDMNAALLSAFAGRSYGTPRTTIEAGPGSGAQPLAQGSLAQTGSIDRPSALPEADTSNKRNFVNRIRAGLDAFTTANQNQPHLSNGSVADEVTQSSTATPQPQAGSEVKPQARQPRPFLSQPASPKKTKQLPKFDAYKSVRRNRRAARRSGHRGGGAGANTQP